MLNYRVVTPGSPIGYWWEHLRPYLRWCYYSLFPGRRPNYLSNCWRYDEIPASRAAAEFHRTRGTAQSPSAFLFLPMTDWHARIQRSHHMARALARLGHFCFYLNPHLGCEYRKPYWLESETRVCELEPGIRELHVHLPAEHAFHDRGLYPVENRRLLDALDPIVGDAGPRITQIVSFPKWLDLSQTLRRRHGYPIIYDCHDYLAGFRNVCPEIVAQEEALFEAADLIAFSSQYLMERTLFARPSLRSRSILVRNAVDFAHFAEPAPAREGRVFGYVGALDHWFDVASVAACARAHADCRFLLIGRIEDDRIRVLTNYSNIELLGEVAYDQLPQYFALFDAGLIPFLPGELTRSADPIKLYEYFSRGLPVVSSRIPEVERYANLVHLGDGPVGFAAAAGDALRDIDPERRLHRIEIARRESWDARAKDLAEALRTMLQMPGVEIGRI